MGYNHDIMGYSITTHIPCLGSQEKNMFYALLIIQGYKLKGYNLVSENTK